MTKLAPLELVTSRESRAQPRPAAGVRAWLANAWGACCRSSAVELDHAPVPRATHAVQPVATKIDSRNFSYTAQHLGRPAPDWNAAGCARGHRCLLHPYSVIKTVWDLVLLPAILWTALVMPVALAFNIDDVGFKVVDNIIWALFAVDLVSQFFTGLVEQESGKLIVSYKVIAWRYVRTWFLVDLISVFPFEWVMPSGANFDNKSARLARLVRLPRALRLLRILKVSRLKRLPVLRTAWTSLEETFLALPAFARVLRTLFASAMAAHWLACVWHWVGVSNSSSGRAADLTEDSWLITDPDPALSLHTASTGARYTACLYYIVTTLTSVGYGDITPTTTGERQYSTFVMVIGLLGSGVLVAEILGVVASLHKQSQGQRAREEGLTHLMRTVEPPKHLRRQLTKWLDDANRTAAAASDVMPMLPPELRHQVLLFSHRSFVASTPLLSALLKEQGGDAVVGDLLWALRAKSYAPGAILFMETMPVRGIVFIADGHVQVSAGERVLIRAGSGSFFGVEDVLFHEEHETTVVALSTVMSFELPRRNVFELTQRHPGLFGLPLRAVALSRMHELGITQSHSSSSFSDDSGADESEHGPRKVPPKLGASDLQSIRNVLQQSPEARREKSVRFSADLSRMRQRSIMMQAARRQAVASAPDSQRSALLLRSDPSLSAGSVSSAGSGPAARAATLPDDDLFEEFEDQPLTAKPAGRRSGTDQSNPMYT